METTVACAREGYACSVQQPYDEGGGRLGCRFRITQPLATDGLEFTDAVQLQPSDEHDEH